MKDIKQEADLLIEQFRPYADAGALVTEEQTINAIHCAITSTENTIKVLEKQKDAIERNGLFEATKHIETELNYTINKQREILNELKSRL